MLKNNPFKGKHHSTEALEKNRLAHLGKKHSEETKKKMRLSAKRGKLNHKWKGDKVGVLALHSWVQRCKGNPTICVDCGTTTKKLAWSNVNHKYRRALDDFVGRCHSCHSIYDRKYNGYGGGKKGLIVKGKSLKEWSKILGCTPVYLRIYRHRHKIGYEEIIDKLLIKKGIQKFRKEVNMSDLNEKYVYEETTITDVKDKPIVRTFDAPQTETFTIKQLEEKIARIEEQKASLDVDIAKVQAKIDEATAALAKV